MVELRISVPDDMKRWIETRAGSGRFVDPSDYLRDLVRRDQERAVKVAAMQASVDDGLASGVSDETMEDIRRTMHLPAE